MPPPRILVTRAPHQASTLADALRALGAEPVLIPTIEIAEPTSFATLDAAIDLLIPPVDPADPWAIDALHRDPPFHWIIFTSANAVEAFHRRVELLCAPRAAIAYADNPEMQQAAVLQKGSPDEASAEIVIPPPAEEPGVVKYRGGIDKDLKGVLALLRYRLIFDYVLIAAIGEATARALRKIGEPPDFVPGKAVSEELSAGMKRFAVEEDGTPKRILIVRAEEGREVLPDHLRSFGAEVTIAPAYRNVIPTGSVEALRELFRDKHSAPDAITFTSSSTVTNFFTLIEQAGVRIQYGGPILAMSRDAEGRTTEEMVYPGSPILASIGPVTSATLREYCRWPEVEASSASVEVLATELVKYLDLRKAL